MSPRRGIDVWLARTLLDRGMSYRQVGIELARLAKRPIPFTAAGVYRAVAAIDKQAP